MNIWIINGFVILHALYIVFGITGIVPFTTACILAIALVTMLTKFLNDVIDSFEIRLICKKDKEE